jgi:hypothetical protein
MKHIGHEKAGTRLIYKVLIVKENKYDKEANDFKQKLHYHLSADNCFF